jgi:RimJ/RimL family protein N-acetyltransferase
VSAGWEGRLVRLRAIEPEDFDVFAAADADADGARAGGRVWPPRSSWATTRWVEEASQVPGDSDEARLAIEALAAGEVVGTVKAQDCDLVAGTCSYGIVVFEWARRQGYGGDAVVVLLRYLFGERRYQKCTVGVHAFNEGSISFHRSLGFQDEGRIRRAHFSGGRHWDEVVLGLTVEEFAARWGMDTS